MTPCGVISSAVLINNVCFYLFGITKFCYKLIDYCISFVISLRNKYDCIRHAHLDGPWRAEWEGFPFGTSGGGGGIHIWMVPEAEWEGFPSRTSSSSSCCCCCWYSLLLISIYWTNLSLVEKCYDPHGCLSREDAFQWSFLTLPTKACGHSHIHVVNNSSWWV